MLLEGQTFKTGHAHTKLAFYKMIISQIRNQVRPFKVFLNVLFSYRYCPRLRGYWEGRRKVLHKPGLVRVNYA